MNVLYLNDIDYSRVKKQFDKTVKFFENDDFDSAEIKKLTISGLYRAKLDYENRLLFKFGKYNGQTYVLLLEVILNHAYEKSRFLRGAKIDEDKLKALKSEKQVSEEEMIELNYINHNTNKFHLLNKALSFDDLQQNIFNLKPPVIIVGSAGSGKTVLTLEKIKQLTGNVLYITLSPFLVDNSSRLYFSDYYVNVKQEVDFLSFKEYMETLKVIPGKEVDFKSFNAWLLPRKHSFGISDAYKLFEEFKGVITGIDITKPFLSKEDYLELGVKQSIFLKSEREKVYDIFTKYLEFLSENNLHDLNIVSFQWLEYSRSKYDFIVIDEVQDFTNIQLYIVLKSLKTSGNFMLCGDSNQIVHPNFFSWTNVKTMFYKHEISGENINVLHTNYRNSSEVTAIANKLLLIKNARFGSIDKESNFLIESLAENKGNVNFYVDSQNRRKQLNDSTKRSTKYAVLVMTQGEKAAAKRVFETPLLFSIHEAKGLEYENIILLNFISSHSKEFNEIASGISKKDLNTKDIDFSRGKDKSDKSLDAFKFYINSLYVGMTRSIKNLYILESSKKHDILALLDLVENEQQINIKAEVSSLDDWKEEARKLELQGKKEQADDIKKNILHIQKPDWEPVTPDNIEALKQEALDPNVYNKKSKDLLFMYALLYDDQSSIESLANLNYKRAKHPEFERNTINRKYYGNYNTDNVKGVELEIKKYGVNFRDQFNLTPLLAAAQNGSLKVIDYLLKQNAETDVTDNNGRNPFRIAIHKLYFSPTSINKLENIFPRLITDSIKIMVKDRMIKIPNRAMEYFLLNIFMTLQDTIINASRSNWEDKGVKASDLESVVAQYPDLIMPDYRKRKTYISSLLSKNEIDGNNPYNNALFIRIGRGYYCINPELSVSVADKWVNIYEFTGLQKAVKLTQEEKERQVIDKLLAEAQEFKKANPSFPNAHELFLLDYKRKMEQAYREKLELKQGSQENNSFFEIEKKNRETERLQKKEEKERIAREKAQKKKEEDEKRQKEIDDSQLRLPF